MPKDAEANEESRLARRAIAGDRVALSTLYHRYAHLLFAFVYHRMQGRRADAEDVFQETWLAAIRSLGTYRGEKRIFSWPCGIARHKTADSGPRRDIRLKGEDRRAPSDLLVEIIDKAPLPDEVVSDIEVRSRVIKAMAQLSNDQRTALMARYADELSVEEVAERLGRTYKATESLLSRARSAMREVMISAHQGGEHG